MMRSLADAITWNITLIRGELENANLTEALRMQSAILVQLEAIRLLIVPTVDQTAKLGAVELNAEALTELARRRGPDPFDPKIRKTFDALRMSVDELAASLHDLTASDAAKESGLI